MFIEIVLIIFGLSGLVGIALDVFQPLPDFTPLNYTWKCPKCEFHNEDDLSKSTFICEACLTEFEWEEIPWSDCGAVIP